MKNPYEYLNPAECATHLRKTIAEVREKLETTEAQKDRAEARKRNEAENASAVTKAHTEAILAEAKENYKIARTQYMEDIFERIDKVKSGMLDYIRQKNLADPSEVDLATMELLKSGILNAADLKNLAEKAAAQSNRTMLRIIAQEAQKRFNDVPGRGLTHDGNPAERVTYLGILELSAGTDEKKYIDALDGLSHIIKNSFSYGADYFDKHTENIDHFMAVMTDQE